MFCCKFIGFLADLAAHQEMTHWKGPWSWRPCMNCANLAIRKHGLDEYECGLGSKFSQFVPNDDNAIWSMVDGVQRVGDHFTSTGVGKTKLENLEKETGFNYHPRGLIQTTELRDLYSPTNHHYRDWMHIMLQDGVANTEVGLLVKRMMANDITISMLQTFFDGCNLAATHGKVQAAWIAPSRIKQTTIKSFSSYMLAIVPVIYMFMVHYGVGSILPAEFDCFESLHYMISLFRLGPSSAMLHIDALDTYIRSHHQKFVDVYGEECLKPKHHHLHHIIANMRYVGKLLSCFVCERKHREVKRTAVYVFRNFEHTTLLDMLNRQIINMKDGHDIFSCQFLVSPVIHDVKGMVIRSSSTAICHVGQLTTGDMVYFKNGTAGKIVHFYIVDEHPMAVRIEALEVVRSDTCIRNLSRTFNVFATVADICDWVIWFHIDSCTIRLCLPPMALFM